MYFKLYGVYKCVKHDNEYNHQLMYIDRDLMLIYTYPSVSIPGNLSPVMDAHSGFLLNFLTGLTRCFDNIC